MMTEKIKKTRRREKIDYSSTSQEAYDNFVETTGLDVPKGVWKKVLYAYNLGFIDYLIKTGEKIRVLHGLGTFHVRKMKHHIEYVSINGVKRLKNAPIDWVETNKQGKLVHIQNFHTDGYKCTYVWGRSAAAFVNANCWIFRFARNAKRSLAAHLKSGNARYSLDRYDEIIKY